MNNPFKSLTALILLSLFFVSCDETDDPVGPYWTYFHSSVDSINCPVDIQHTDTLHISFYISYPSCCYWFYRFDASTSSNNLTVKAIGKQRHNIACCMAAKQLIEIYSLDQLSAGILYIEVLQPRGTSIIDSVLVL